MDKIVSALTIFNFFMAAIIGPKYIPLGWKPKVSSETLIF